MSPWKPPVALSKIIDSTPFNHSDPEHTRLLTCLYKFPTPLLPCVNHGKRNYASCLCNHPSLLPQPHSRTTLMPEARAPFGLDTRGISPPFWLLPLKPEFFALENGTCMQTTSQVVFSDWQFFPSDTFLFCSEVQFLAKRNLAFMFPPRGNSQEAQQ